MSADRPEDADALAPSPDRAGLRTDAIYLVVVALVAFRQLCNSMGTSPTIWEDTLIENLYVRDCLVDNHCTAVGAGATVGIFHSAGYLHWRSLLHAVGLHANGTFLTFHVLNALGVGLVAVAARRIAGPVAAALAVLIMVAGNGVPTQLNVISDVAPVPFLGAVFLLLAQTATARPTRATTVALGLLCGVMLNFYATGLLCGVSAVIVTLRFPKDRWKHTALVMAAFVVSTFVLSPLTWLVDLRIVLTRHIGHSPGMMNRLPLLEIPLAALSALALLLWGVSALWPPLRRRLDVVAAVILPLFVPVLAGYLRGSLDVQDKYFAHVVAAIAVGVGAGAMLPLNAAARWALGRLETRFPSRKAGIDRFSAMVRRSQALALPLAALLVFAGFNEPADTIEHLSYSYADVLSTARYLARARGWTSGQAQLGLLTPDELARRAAIRWATGWRASGTTSGLEHAYMLKMPVSDVLMQLPTGAEVVRRAADGRTVVVSTCSWIDWTAFRACTRRGDAPETCMDTALPIRNDGHQDYSEGIPGMPNPDGRDLSRQTLTLHFPLHPRPECPVTRVVMPRLPLLCPGVIASVDGVPATIEDSGRRVLLRYDTRPGAPQPRELAISWELGVPACWNQFRGHPPFVIEGDPDAVPFIERMIDPGPGAAEGPP